MKNLLLPKILLASCGSSLVFRTPFNAGSFKTPHQNLLATSATHATSNEPCPLLAAVGRVSQFLVLRRLPWTSRSVLWISSSLSQPYRDTPRIILSIAFWVTLSFYEARETQNLHTKINLDEYKVLLLKP